MHHTFPIDARLAQPVVRSFAFHHDSFLLNTVAITIAFDNFSSTMHLSLLQILYSSIAIKSQHPQFQSQEWKQYGTMEPLVLATSYPGCSNSPQAQSKRKDPGYIVVVNGCSPRNMARNDRHT